MQFNRSAWDLYPSSHGNPIDLNFAGNYIDPLYAPYHPYWDPRTGEYGNASQQDTLLNPDRRSIYPGLVRKGWGLSYQKQFSYDPCAPGWISAKNPDGRDSGWCKRQPSYITPIFYSPLGPADKKQQYGEGYAPRQWEVGVPYKSNYGLVVRKPMYGKPGFSENFIHLD